jgi:hypothetical protein
VNLNTDELTELIEDWQDKLGTLGILHWRIKEVTIGPSPPGGENANASVWSSSSYDTCEFYFKDSYIEEATQQDVEETIIHEWLHVAWRDMDRASEAGASWFTQAAWDDWSARFDHEREGLIDRLSRAFYELHNDT